MDIQQLVNEFMRGTMDDKLVILSNLASLQYEAKPFVDPHVLRYLERLRYSQQDDRLFQCFANLIFLNSYLVSFCLDILEKVVAAKNEK